MFELAAALLVAVISVAHAREFAWFEFIVAASLFALVCEVFALFVALLCSVLADATELLWFADAVSCELCIALLASRTELW